MPAARHFSRSPCMRLRGHGDDDDARLVIWMRRGVFLSFADHARGLQTVHFRHHHVHENQIIGLSVKRVERFASVGGEVRLITDCCKMRAATFWLMALSSHNRMRNGKRSASGWPGFERRLAARFFLAEQRALKRGVKLRGFDGFGDGRARKRCTRCGAASARVPSGVSKTRGIIAVPDSLRISAASARPSMPGICASSMARSNGSPARSQFERLLRVFGAARDHSPLRRLFGQHAAAGRVVVHNQNAASRPAWAGGPPARTARRLPASA